MPIIHYEYADHGYEDTCIRSECAEQNGRIDYLYVNLGINTEAEYQAQQETERPPLTWVGDRPGHLTARGASTLAPRNAKCPCSSGRKTKACHGRPVILPSVQLSAVD